jgi:hypothetical protein
MNLDSIPVDDIQKIEEEIAAIDQFVKSHK